MPVVLPIMAGTVLTMVRDDLLSSAVASGLALVASMQATAPELKAKLEEMDIEAMLKTVEAVVNEVEYDFNNKLKEQPNTPISPAPAAAPASAPASMAKADAKLDAKSDAKKAATPTPTPTTAPKSGSGPGPASAPTSPPTATATVKDKEEGWIDVSKDASKAAASSASAPASMSSPLTGVKEATAALASATVIPGAMAPDSVHFTKRKKSSLLNRSGNSAVALAVDHIEETCVRMHSALLDLDAAAKAHGARYFAGLRNPGYDPILERLRALQTVMDKRVDMLLKVLSLKSLTSQHVSWQNSHGSGAAPASAAASAGLSISAMTPSSTSAPAPTK